MRLIDERGRRRKGYAKGHWPRPARRVNDPKWSAGHGRSRRVLRRQSKRCAWEHIGGCKGDLHVAHVNGDWQDNDVDNLRVLCRSHHWLLDNGRIDPAQPIMPYFYTDRSGKRRYTHA